MYWDDLTYFVCLVEKRTLTACAEEMNVQHSTVARRIEHLEQTLGVNLFDRLGKRYVLTIEGERLYHQAVEVKKEMVTFQRMAIDQNALQGKVVVSAPPVWANEVLIPALVDFRQRFPDIVLTLSGDVSISNLHQREADIAIRTRRPTQEDLVIRTLGSSTYRFYAHNDYLNHTIPEQWQLIEFTANARALAWSQAFMQQQDYTIAFSTNDLYMACHAARQKIGFALLPEFLARQYSELTALDPINRVTLTDLETHSLAANYAAAEPLQPEQSDTHSPIPLAQSYPLYLVMHPDVRRSARVRAVADWLIACSTRLDGFA